MSKNNGMSMLLLAILIGFNFSTHADKYSDNIILIDGPEVDLTLSDVRTSLLSVESNIRSMMLSNKQKLREVMDSTYISKVMNYRAVQKRLDKNLEIQAKIRSRTMEVLGSAELESVVENSMKSNEEFEAAAWEYYLANPSEFAEPEQISVSHILLKQENSQSSATGVSQAEEILKDIKSKRITFEEAARIYSGDEVSSKAGGALEKFARGSMVKPFEEAAFSLSHVGELSKPVVTRYGVHLIRLDEKIPVAQKQFESVKKQIIEKLQKSLRSSVRMEYLIKIRDDTRVKLNEEAIQNYLSFPMKKEN